MPRENSPRLLCAFVALLSWTVSASAQQSAAELKAQFRNRVEAIASGVDGIVGYRIVDMTTGDVVAMRNEQRPFPTASTIKLSILYEMFTEADAGTLALDQPKPLDMAQVVGGSGVLQHLSGPALSLRDLATLMIVLSDNTATNVVIDAVGMDKVNARMAALGFSDIRLRRKMMDAAAVARGDENVASPGSLERIAERLWKGEGLTPASRDAARKMLHAVPGQIRNAVPGRIPVASKTGTLAAVRAEAAVVELPNHPFGLSVMTTYLKNDEDGEKAIHDIAEAAFSYFDRIATGGAYGRRP